MGRHTLIIMSYTNRFIAIKGKHESLDIFCEKYIYTLANEINNSGLFTIYDCDDLEIKENIKLLKKSNYVQF